MKTQVTAITSFMHGCVHMHAGETGEFTKGDAKDLIEAGLVREGGTDQTEQPTEQDGDLSDLLDDSQKAEPAPENKMDQPAENKMDESPDNKATRARKKG